MDIQGYYDEYKRLDANAPLVIIFSGVNTLLFLCNIFIFYHEPSYLSVMFFILEIIGYMILIKYNMIETCMHVFHYMYECFFCDGLERGLPVDKQYQSRFDKSFGLFVLRRNSDLNVFYASYLEWLLETKRLPPHALIPELIISKEEYEVFKRYNADTNTGYDPDTDYGLDIMDSRRGLVPVKVFDKLDIPYDKERRYTHIQFPKVEDARIILNEMYGK